MTRTKLENKLMEWIGKLPEEEYTSVLLITERATNGTLDARISFRGDSVDMEETIAALLAYERAKGYTKKTINIVTE